MENTNVVLAVFELELVNYELDFDGIDAYKEHIPNSIRKLIPYRGYSTPIKVNEDLIGTRVYFLESFTDDLLNYETHKPIKVNKRIFSNLKEINDFIKSKEYELGPIQDFILLNFDCMIPVFRLTKLNVEH